MKNLKLPILATFVLGSTMAIAQIDGGSAHLLGSGVSMPFATDYQAIGINPANLSFKPQFEDRHIAFGFGDASYSAYSEFLDRERISQITSGEGFAGDTRPEKIQFAQDFAGKNSSWNSQTTLFGFAWHGNRLGLGVKVGTNLNFNSRFGSTFSDLLFLGKTALYFDQLVLEDGSIITNRPNLPQSTIDDVEFGFVDPANAQPLSAILDGTRIGAQLTTDINFSGSFAVVDNDDFQVSAGLGVKYVIGFALLNLDYADGNQEGFIAYSPIFDINLDEVNPDAPSSFEEGAGNLSPAGRGLGFDIGTTVTISNTVRASASITDIGSIDWDGNVFALTNQDLLELSAAGIEAGETFNPDSLLFGENAIVKWEGNQQVNTALPTKLRLGGGVMLAEKLEFGGELIVPMNDSPGNIEKPMLALGGTFSPIKSVSGSLGLVTGGFQGTRVPIGITLSPGNGVYEFALSTGDITSIFRPDADRLAFALGWLRFRI